MTAVILRFHQSATNKGESDAKSADHAEHIDHLIDGRRQEESNEQDRSEPKQVRSGRNIAVSPAPRNGDGSEPAGLEAPTESVDAQISAPIQSSQWASSHAAKAPEQAASPPVVSSGAPIPDDGLTEPACADDDQAANTKSVPIPDEAVPAFLLKDHARPNERCEHPTGCRFAFSREKITCAKCTSWMAKRKARESEAA